MSRHLISLADHDRAWIEHVLDVAFALRAERQAGRANEPILAGRTLVMIFEKPSLRTWVSFEQAMLELGGNAIGMPGGSVGLGSRESPADVARVLAGMVHGICARVYDHGNLLRLAEHATVPVINALSDYSHPCQALADMMTIMDEFGRDLTGRTLAYVGDGNNVTRSLATACARLGLNLTIAAPEGYHLEESFIERTRAEAPNMVLRTCNDPVEAVRDADVVYTDTWVSMGQEAEKDIRRKVFGGYQINEALMDAAPAHAIVLHCLPAYRGWEITDGVLDGPRSRVFPQAHNRLHAQKGLLAVLMGGR